jgi:hypothetical protein
MCVYVRWLKDQSYFCKIEPPYFKNVALVKFSPTGNLLLIGNENCQHCYIYRMFKAPNSKYPHCACKLDVKLIFSLFRGYTEAVVVDCSFANNPQPGDEKFLLINSCNGTSHVYKLNSSHQKSHVVFKRDIGPVLEP